MKTVTVRLTILLLLTSQFCLGGTKSVSMISVISDPEIYEGKKIQVEGYLVLQHEGDILYFDHNHAHWGMRSNALWLELSKEQLIEWDNHKENYVSITGIFHKSVGGHFNSHTIELRDITRIYTRVNRDDFKKMIEKSKADYNKRNPKSKHIK